MLGPRIIFYAMSTFNIIALFLVMIVQPEDANSEKKTSIATDLNQLLLEDNESENDAASVDSRVEFF